MDFHTETNESALAAWDRGDSVWSCELGGLGPGYEQCIQIMGFEMLRAMLAHPGDWSKMSGEEGRDEWRKYIAMIEAVPTVSAVVEKLNPSGAQHSAAMKIASVFSKNGYSAGMEMVPQDLRIMVSKNFPSLEPVAREHFKVGTWRDNKK